MFAEKLLYPQLYQGLQKSAEYLFVSLIMLTLYFPSVQQQANTTT
jgi:hypothetical protein